MLVAIIVSPLFLVAFTGTLDEQVLDPEFFVGVEYAIDNNSVEDAKALVDRVKNFTNLFVVDSLGITLHMGNLNEVCDYVYESGLHFVVFFVSLHYLDADGYLVLRYDYYPHLWMIDATKKYGDKFLGAYAMDEPGGNQLDQGDFRMINSAEIDDITEAGDAYVELLDIHATPYTFLLEYENITILTSDYGLYWFDYKSGYDTILVEFAWNHSRPLHLGLCRGAANVQDRDWGVMITWTYEQSPYIVSADELYDDLITAYHNGAKYVVIFDYPATDYSKYGILTDEHFDALQRFWNYVNGNPDKHGTIKADVAYVLPENFGFGFRGADDKIWGAKADVFTEKVGQWSAGELAEKVWSDVNQLLDEYGFRLDIVYSDPEFDAELPRLYDKLFFWNETVN